MDFTALATQVGQLLLKKSYRLVTAESCTGGLVAEILTRIEGSSKWFDRGFVTYSNEAKHELLSVSLQALNNQGAVSEAVALQMAKGALRHSQADIALSITGIAGPGGATLHKPVGHVCFALYSLHGLSTTWYQQFQGDRLSIREHAAYEVLKKLSNHILCSYR